MATDKKELWVDWTHDAAAALTPPDGPIEDEDAEDALVDDMVALTTKYADRMLEEYEATFEKGGKSRRRGKRVREEEED